MLHRSIMVLVVRKTKASIVLCSIDVSICLVWSSIKESKMTTRFQNSSRVNQLNAGSSRSRMNVTYVRSISTPLSFMIGAYSPRTKDWFRLIIRSCWTSSIRTSMPITANFALQVHLSAALLSIKALVSHSLIESLR